MAAFELTFANTAIIVTLALGEPLHVVESRFAVEVRRSRLVYEVDAYDAEINRRYVTLRQSGIVLLFEEDRLRSVSLYIRPPEAAYAKFEGRVSLLPDDFFTAPSKDRFIQALLKSGFAIWPKAYPNAVDLVSADLRVRYSDNPNTDCHVGIDDGSMLRQRRNGGT